MAAYNTIFNWDPGANSAETNFTLTTQGEDSTGGDEAQILLSLSQTDNSGDVDEAADAYFLFPMQMPMIRLVQEFFLEREHLQTL